MAEQPSESLPPITAPGPSGRSLLELVPQTLQSDPLEIAVTLRERHGHVVRIPPVYPGLEKPAYLVSHPDDIQEVLQSNPTAFRGLDVPGANDFGKVVDNSIVSLTEDDDAGSWTGRLRKLAPEFRERTAHEHVPRLALETLATLAEYDAAASSTTRRRPTQSTSGPVGQFLGSSSDPARVWATPHAVRLLPAMRRLSLRLLGVTLFGPDVRAHEAAVIRAVTKLRQQFKNRQLDVLRGVLSSHLPRVQLPSVLSDALGHDVAVPFVGDSTGTEDAIRTLEAVADAIVSRRERTPAVYDDALATWLTRPDPATGEVLDGEVVRAEVVGLLLAGFATLSAAMTWAVALAAAHPRVQDRIYREAHETDLFASLDARDSPTDADQDTTSLDSLSYTRCVWREALRLYPTLPVFGRMARHSVTLGGYDIEADAPVFVSPYVTHRDPEFWTAPDVFDPDRFRPARHADRHEFAYFPFSGGPHACLGEAIASTEAVTALAALFSTYRVTFADDDPLAQAAHSTDEEAGTDNSDSGTADAETRVLDDVGLDSAINLQPARDITVRFLPR